MENTAANASELPIVSAATPVPATTDDPIGMPTGTPIGVDAQPPRNKEEWIATYTPKKFSDGSVVVPVPPQRGLGPPTHWQAQRVVDTEMITLEALKSAELPDCLGQPPGVPARVDMPISVDGSTREDAFENLGRAGAEIHENISDLVTRLSTCNKCRTQSLCHRMVQTALLDILISAHTEE